MEVKRLTQSEERVAKRRRTEKKNVKLVAVESEKNEADGFLRKVKNKEGQVCKRGSIGVGVSGVEVLSTAVSGEASGLGALHGGNVEWRREKETLAKALSIGVVEGKPFGEARVGSLASNSVPTHFVNGLLGSMSVNRKEKRLTTRVSVKG